MYVEIIHVPIHVGHHEVNCVVDVDDFLNGKFALVVNATAVWVLVCIIEPLTLRHQSCITDSNIAILVNVNARTCLQVTS